VPIAAVAFLNAKNLKLLQIVPTVPGATAAVGQRSIKDSGAGAETRSIWNFYWLQAKSDSSRVFLFISALYAI
jgi:hypothetical protein